MAKSIEIILLFLSILILSNGESLKKVLNKHRKLEVSANLNFIKAYDLIYMDNKWSFKIKTDTELQNQANVLVDIFVVSRSGTTTSETAYCIYYQKILSCTRSANTQYDNDLIELAGIKKLGTVDWENLNLKEYKIPLNTTMTYIKAYGLFFANKWIFMIDAKTIAAIPHYSKAYIDIIHNSVETTATCEILGNFANYVTNIQCISDYGIQNKNDEIKINLNKKYGGIEWSPGINNSQATIEEISDYSEISLPFVDAYDLFYDNNVWVFTIHARSNQNINPGTKYLVDIHYASPTKDQDSFAACLLKEGMKSITKILFICSCIYNDQGENDLIQIKYPKTETSTISWTTGISQNYKISLKTSLTLVKAYNLTFSNIWSFNIDVTDGILPADSKIIIDIYISGSPSTVNCTSINNNYIFCSLTTNNAHSTSQISLSKEKSEKASVYWKKNLQNDYRIYLYTKLNYRGAYNMTFNDTDNKWYFTVKVLSAIYNSKVIIDILYGEKSSTATCICMSIVSEYNCVVDEINQNKKTLIKMNQLKSESSTVTMANLNNNDNIILTTDLTLSKTGLLQLNPRDGETWIFDLYIEEENIPENSAIIVDTFIIFSSEIMGYYNVQERTSTANCVYTYKKLSCEADPSYKGHEYKISLQLEKTEGSKSSVKAWNNAGDFREKSVNILLMSAVNFHYCTHIELIEGKYIFYCNFHKSTPISRYSEVTIDILVEDRPSISHCVATDFYNLKCEISQEDYKPQNNFLSSKKTRKSTLTFNYLTENQYLFPIELEFVQAYNSKSGEFLTEYPFKILAKGDKIKDGLRFDVVVMHVINSKNLNLEEKAACEVYGGVFFCWWYSYYTKIDKNFDTYYLLLRNDGDDIKWINPGNYNFMEDFWIRLRYINLISIDYKPENERYEFSLKVEKKNTEDISQYNIILDLYIYKQPTYALCFFNEYDDSIINCNTAKTKYRKATIIELINRQNLGNVIWTNINGNITLYGTEYYYILSDRIYDLKFESNKWKFIIKPLNIIPFEGTKQMDILINDDPGYAKCNINNEGLVIFEVDSDGIKNTDLIRLYKDNTESETEIQMYNVQNDGIPFNINLEFIQAYDLIFDNEKQNWYFKIKAKVINDPIIPEGSTFSTDILYENNKETVAFCSQMGNIENNIILLLCRPEYKKNETVSISLNVVDNIYSSITWTKPLSADDINMVNIAELDVIKVDNLEFDISENKWNFNMYVSDLSDTDLFLNSKVKIDLIYNNEEILGTCILKELDKFSCSPDYENQKNNDIVVISPTKINGSVTFKNRKIKLKFGVKLTYENYYNLKFIDSKWEFIIKLSDYDIEDGDEIPIDIMIDDLNNYADCTLNSNILFCKIKRNEQTINNKIKLINNSQNTYLKWTNLPEIVEMDKANEIDINNLCGEGYYKIEGQESKCSKLPPDENYVFDPISNQWRKCDERCKKCYKQTSSNLDHQCLLCNDNYYPYKTDYDNFKNPISKITGFNCYTLSEVKNNNINYYLSSNNFFEKCDFSCLECESESNFCKVCNSNYYNILGFKNGTCFKDPLEGYGLINIEGEIFLKKCFHLCKYCTQITQSFFYPQCKECYEDNFTLDLFSYQESFCIPKDKSNSSFIAKQTKWYIDNFEGIEQFNIENENIIIDFERLLNNMKYNNIAYKIVDKCPENKPYIIYSIRQCVNSCNNTNLIEHGIFMTKKLYFYNNICYDKCPYGSIEDDKDMKCIEINQYTKINNSISINSFLENNNENILNYLSKYANNSVSITRNNDFSNYFYNKNTNDSFKMSLNMPIFNFSECINLLKINFALNDETDIFIGIMEYYIQTDKNGKYAKNRSPVNSTTYQFFTNNGTILDHSICFDKKINVTVQKMVDINKLNEYIDIIKEINDNYNLSSLYNNGTEFNDKCIPLSLSGKDLTVYDRQLLVSKIIKPCDDNCEYIDFNFTSNYSTCTCPIDLPNNKKFIDNQIKDALKETDIGQNFDLLLENANWKYIKCSNNFFKLNYSLFFFIIHLFFYIFEQIFPIIYCKLLIKPKNQNKKEIQNNEDIISQDSNTNKQDEDSDNTEMDRSEEKKNSAIIYDVKSGVGKKINVKEKPEKKSEFCKNLHFFQNFKENFLYGIFKKEWSFGILFIILIFPTYFFFNVFLFSDKYISVRYSYKANIPFPYIIWDEISRISVATFFSFLFLKILKWILDIIKDCYYNNKLFSVIIIIIIFNLPQIFCFYFNHIFININPKSLKAFIMSTIFSLIIHLIIEVIIILIKSLLKKWIKENKCIKYLSLLVSDDDNFS